MNTTTPIEKKTVQSILLNKLNRLDKNDSLPLKREKENIDKIL